MLWRSVRANGFAQIRTLVARCFMVAATIAMLVTAPVMAAPVQIKPAPLADCEGLKQTFSTLIGLPLKLKNAKPDNELFFVQTSGEACVITGSGTGASALFGDVLVALDEYFQNGGWKEVLDIAADGPDSTRAGYAKGSRMVVYFLSSETPLGKCEPDPKSGELPECNLPAGEWVWTIDIITYDKVR